MNTDKVTPKDFVLWIGAMVSLYAGAIAFISLLFEYINKVFPNPISGSYYVDPYSSGISYQLASLIVLTPVFLILMRLIRRDIASDATRNDIWVRRWSLFLTLFLAGATMVIDIIVLLNTFLQGEELTTGFILKVLVVFLVTGLAFMHFLADLRGYWEQQPQRAKFVNYGVGCIVLIAIVAGFFILGTPQELRRLKQDAIRVQDLQNIQWQVVNFWQQKEILPANLEALKDPIAGVSIPVDPKTGESYTYEKSGTMSFKLCASFELAGGLNPSLARPVDMSAQDDWQHEAGQVCYDRTIDPERYPPYIKAR